MRQCRLLIPLTLLGVLVAILGLLACLVAEQTRWDPPALDLSLLSPTKRPPDIRQLSAHLWTVDGLKLIVARGAPREMGRQYGAAVAADIKRGIEMYLHRHLRDGQGYSTDYLLRCARDMERHTAPEYIEEMKGVAEGSGVSYEDVLVMHTHADTVHFGHDWGKPGADKDPAPAQCSNFAAWGPATADGKVYHGRNLDWTTGAGIQDCAVVYVGIPDRGNPFALVTYAGLIGAVTGMNAQGITFGEMTSSTADETLNGEPLMIICRRILQHCSNLVEVESTVGGYAGTTGWNFMVASGQERSARAFEVDAGDKVCFRPNDPDENHPPVSQGLEDAIIRTNHPVSPLMQRKAARKYDIENLELAKLAIRGMDTWQRYESLRRWISGEWFGKVDARVARAMLQSKPVCAGNNLHSVVFAPTDLKMWVANATSGEGRQPAYTQPYHLIELSTFLPPR